MPSGSREWRYHAGGLWPPWFERDAPLVLQFTSHSEPGRIGARMMGAVEGFDEFGMRVRLAPTPGP